MATTDLSATYVPATSSSIGALLRDTATLYRRALLKMRRTPAMLYFSLVQPLIWFLLFGQLFSRLTTGFGTTGGEGGANSIAAQLGTDNYSAFFLPAIMIQVMLFGSMSAALGITSDEHSGYLNRLRVTPINRLAVLAGMVLADLTRMLAQVTILLIVGVIFGVRIEHLAYLPLIYVLAALFGLTMSGVGLFVGLTTRNPQSTMMIINFLFLPLMFTSTAQLPLAFLPGWLQTVARVNPVTYAVNSIRVVITGLNAEQVADGQSALGIIGVGIAMLAVLAAIVLAVATARFRRQVR